jgi:hypothetical protein
MEEKQIKRPGGCGHGVHLVIQLSPSQSLSSRLEVWDAALSTPAPNNTTLNQDAIFL